MTLIKVKSRGTDNVTGRKNMLINGDMQIAQRGTSLAMAHDGLTSPYLIDRWRIILGGTHEQLDGTYAQVADHPTSVNGKSLKWTTGTAESSYDADEYAYVVQIIEAQNAQHLQYGNSNAKTITVSFYVKSSITGTYAVGLYKPDSTGRIFNKTYTISSANTWEKKTISFVGDTSGGGIVNDNGQGLWVSWHLATGSDYSGGDSTSGWSNYSNDRWATGQAANVMTTANATWQMTECQVEVNDSATDFEHRSFGEELSLCQRYYCQSYPHGVAAGSNSGATVLRKLASGNGYDDIANFHFPTEMRAVPTIALYNPITGTANGFRGDSANYTGAAINSATTRGVNIYKNSSVGATVFMAIHATATAEL